MTKKWHVNPNTGNPGRCSVDWNNPNSRGCPHQLSQNEHFSTAADASNFYSQQRESQFDVFEGATMTSAPQPVRNLKQLRVPNSDVEEPQYLSKQVGEKSFWGRNGKKIGSAVLATFAISAAGSLIFGGDQTEGDAAGPTGDIGEYVYEDPEASTVDEEVDTPKDYSIVEDTSVEQPLPEKSEAEVAEPRDYGAEVGNKIRETGQQMKDYVTPERVDKLKEAGESTKDFLGGVIDGVTGYGKTESIPVEIPGAGSKLQSSESARFQGESMKPSKKEVLEAQATLKKLKVVDENEGAYYNRVEQFGRSFETGVVGKLEHRDLPNATFKNSAPQSRAIAGGFTDPYTGEFVEVIKGSSNDTNVDHIVPLHEVVKSEDSADPLTSREKIAIANDFDNLQVVGASINKSKGDKDPGQWLPPNAASHQRYAIATINVKSKYGLTVDPVEHRALAEVLASRQ